MGRVRLMPGRKWGGVARRGAGKVDPNKPPPRGRGGQKPPPKQRREPKELGPPPAWEPELWIEEPDADVRPLRKAATKAVSRGGKPTPRDRARRTAPADVATDISTKVPRGQAVNVEQRLMEAAKAFERERYKDADRLLKPLAEHAPDVPAVRELYGLTLYRLGRWKAATNQLEAFRQLTGSVEQHPVLADSYRALGRHRKAEQLWDELRTADAPGELVTEGRIVAGGSLADRSDIAGAIRLLEKGPVQVKRPKAHHIRLWYALADLYERAGDTPKARELFKKVVANEPDFADAAERAAALN
ncbi:MAG: tetratricopeptide repeat protein [Actinobacteria bacterium]|nr:MAG: tetratricopeptide repeat protein [Actinomycetota bacterium]